MRTAISTLLVVICTSLVTLAQTEQTWVAFRITKVDRKGKSIYVTINSGNEIGISLNQKGEVYLVVGNNRKNEDKIRFLGNSVFEEVGTGQSISKVDTEETVQVGDIVFTQIEIPKGSHTPFYYLAIYGIEFTDNSGKPYYTLDEILKSDGQRLQTEKFITMQQLINEAGKELKASGNKDKVIEGKDKGKLLHDVLIETDTIKLWSYLIHVVQDYERTSGQSMPLAKGYMAYALEGDLITPAELKVLFALKDSASWSERYEYYKRRIDSELVENWYKEAKEMHSNSQFDEALNLLHACVFLGDKLGELYNTGKYLYEIAAVYDTQGDNQNAIRWFKKADDFFNKDGSLFGRGYALHFIARAYSLLSQNQKAEEFYVAAIQTRLELVKSKPEETSNAKDLITSADALASLYNSMQRYDDAIRIYESAIEFAKSYKLNINYADDLWNTGTVYADGKKDYLKSNSFYELAIPVYLSSDVNDSSSAVILKRNIASNYKKVNRIKESRQAIAEGVSLARQLGNQFRLAYALDYQGYIAKETKDFNQAFTSYAEAEKIYIKLDSTKKLIVLKKDFADAYSLSKRYSLAEAKMLERIKLISPEDYSSHADAYWSYAFIYGKENANNPRKALELYRVAEMDYIKLKDTVNLITILNNVAYQYRDLGDSVNAYKEHNRALVLAARKSMRESRADTYERIASTANKFKNVKRAVDSYQKAIAIYKELNNQNKVGSVLELIADIYEERSDYVVANDYLTQSINVYRQAGDKAMEAESYWDLAYNQGQYMREFDTAIENYRTAYGLYIDAKDSVHASVMLSNIGQNYWSKLDFEKAIESHKAAIELAEKCRNYEQVAKSWSKLATLYTESGNPVASTEALERAAEMLQNVNDSTLLSTTYHDLASAYSTAKDYAKAFNYFGQAITIRKALKDTINWATSLYQFGGAYHNKGQYKEAMTYYNQCIALQRKVNDKANIIYTLASMGIISQSVDGDYKRAEQYFNEAIKHATALKDDFMLAYCYSRKKGLYRSQGNAKLADESINKALSLYSKLNNNKEVANTLIDIGYDQSYVYGNNTKALEYIARAQKISDTLNDVSVKASIFGAQSSIMREMGEFNKALEYAKQSFDLYKKLDNEWGMAGAYIDLGNIYKQLSEYTLALQNQLKSDSLYKKMNSEYSRLAPLANMGEIYTSQGDYKKGLEFYQQSYAIMKKANDLNENLAIIQTMLGESYYYLENYPESDKWLKEALKTCDLVGAIRPKTDALAMLGRLKIEEKKYDEAFTYLSEGARIAKEKSMKISYAFNIASLGQLEVERKNYTKAKPILEESIKTSREMGKYSTLWESLYWLGILYKENNQLKESSEYLKESISIIEKIRNSISGGEEARKMFSSDKHILKVYEALVDVLLKQGETDLAMSYIQKNNEDNLKEKFKGLDVKFENSDKNKVIEQERDMKAKLDGIEQQIAKEKALPAERQNQDKLKRLEGIKTVAETDYLKFVNQQVNVRPELSKYFNNSVQPAQLKGKKKQIPKDMALLSYLPGENQLYIFVATTDTVVAKVVNVPRTQLNRNINGALNIIRTRQGEFGKSELRNEEAERKELVFEQKQTDDLLKPFEELYQYLIAPASEIISEKKRLCIIPNGSLSYIPFQLLAKTLKNGKLSLLMNQYAVFYANSTDMLLRATDEESKQLNILAFGNPDKTLPSTEKEVKDIKTLFPNASVFLRDDATEDKAKYAGETFNVMHFATHGNLDYEDFAKSFLTMAENPAKHEDGMLTLEELWGMDVMSHLNIVVLSACQTAVSKGSDESSPVSPASGFLQNGVKSVVATLWKVDDEATSLMMSDFYKNIKTMDAVDALRMAQINLANNPKFSHPYYWAAAVLLGDWR